MLLKYWTIVQVYICFLSGSFFPLFPQSCMPEGFQIPCAEVFNTLKKLESYLSGRVVLLICVCSSLPLPLLYPFLGFKVTRKHGMLKSG